MVRVVKLLSIGCSAGWMDGWMGGDEYDDDDDDEYSSLLLDGWLSGC